MKTQGYSANSPAAIGQAGARIGIDIGGTFTDLALSSGGRLYTHKQLTTPRAPEVAVIEGLRVLLARAAVQAQDLVTVVHGTTLATNAVIERRGARVAFITTEGFRDTLEMANESRYDHYDLAIEKPAPIVPRDLRFAVSERIAADGSVLTPLDRAAIDALLPALDAAEVQAVAIGFLHSYRNPAHEQAARERLAALRPGLPISISSEVAPEVREFERFATVCVNAFVQPLVTGYLGRLEEALVGMGVKAPLLLMMSNGGLATTEVACRFPVRLLESGPAGGAILGARIARRYAVDSALVVDIGGTTAKLCLVDGGEPQTARTMEVARIARFKPGSGIPLRFPVIELAEIGAGGGSVARVNSLGQLAVGPESAGADPGPACYGLGGGGFTVTDAHLLAGRIDPLRFAGGAIRPDIDLAHKAAQPVANLLGVKPLELAEAVCELVEENMSTAAREHAVELAKSVAGRTLVAIGGMAPLHAARLAAKLGIERVIVPREAGVGSAAGFLAAPIAFETTRGEALPLARLVEGVLATTLAELRAPVAAIVARAAPCISTRERCYAWMRYRGQGHEIRVELAAGMFIATALRAAFETAYLALYSRIVADAPIEILGWTIRIEADAGEELPAEFEALVEDTQVVLAPGFSCSRSEAGDWIIERCGRPNDSRLPALLHDQVLWARLIGVVEEQARTLMRTAFSPTVREAGDLSAGLFDPQGRLLAQAVTGTPGHVNSMAACAAHFLARMPLAQMAPGDHFVTNDPWLTSGHLHDVTVFSPVFRGGEPVAFFACTCHQVDIGGLGQGPDGRSVYEEGLAIPVMHLARGGAVNEDLLAIVRANVRQPELVVGDLLSYITANEFSALRLNAMLDEFAEAGLSRIGRVILEQSRRGMEMAIQALPPGRYLNRMVLDGYDRPVEINCCVEIGDGRVHVGFDGSSPASAHGINLVLNYTRAYAAFGVRAAIGPEVPNNAGSLALVEVDAPVGSILNVLRPAPVSARHIIGQFLPEVVLGALASALPDRVPAEGAACNWGLQLRGMPEEPFEILFFNAGGSGARPSSDGLSATAFPSGIRAIPVEICEISAPIVIQRKELLPGSGGAGRYRGGLGQRVEVRTRSGRPFQVFGIFDRVRNAARGRAGGADGQPGWVGLASGEPLRSMGLQVVPAGAMLRIDVPGGAGYGSPALREQQAVADDRRLGYLTS